MVSSVSIILEMRFPEGPQRARASLMASLEEQDTFTVHFVTTKSVARFSFQS